MKINLQNIDQWCILFIDNALTNEEKVAFELFIAENEAAQQLLQSYQHTKLPEEEILIFEDKALLYRFDTLDATLDSDFKKRLYKNEANILRLPVWIKWSASIAALFILVWGTQFISSPNKIISDAKNNIQIKNQHAPTIANNAIENNTTETKNHITTTEHAIAKIATLPITGLDIKPKNIIVQNEIVSSQEATTEAMMATQLDQENNSAINEMALNNKIVEKNISNNTETKSIKDSEPPITFEEDEDHVIYVGSLEINGDKLRGISRRVGALFKKVKLTDKEK